MDLNKYLNNAAPSEPQYSKEEYAAMKKIEREAVWVQVDARMGEVLADAPALQGFLDFMSQCRNSLPNQLLLSGQNADITDARIFQQWKDAGRHIRTGEEGYTAIIGQMYKNNGRKASGYNIGKVFDITQTRGRPVPPPANYQVDELVAAAIESSPVPIQISDSLPDSIQAQYVPKNRTIYVRNGMDAGTTLCAIVRERAQADFHKDYTYNRQAYAAPSYCAAYMVAHRYGLDTTAFNFDRVVALYGNLGKEQQRGFLSDVNTVDKQQASGFDMDVEFHPGCGFSDGTNFNTSAAGTAVKKVLQKYIKKVFGSSANLTDAQTCYYLYGERIANGTNQQFHPGVDINYYEGAPIYALYGGTVVYSGGTYGTVSIRVPSQNNIVTNYIHMKNIPVVEGQTVNAGQIIGYQSNAGVDATHLHFEIRPAGSTGPAGSSLNPRNPLTTIRPYGYMAGE